MIIEEKLKKPFEKYKSKEKLIFKCDYCGKETEKTKNNLIHGRKIIQKDSCSNYECVKIKIKESTLKKYGTEYSFQSKEIKEKIKQTNIERYGIENPTQLPEIKEKRKKTNIKRYGAECSLQSPEIQEKIKQTNIQRYGAENPLQSKEIQEKIKQTNIQRYGAENPLQSEEIQEKIKQTNIQRYGIDHPTQLPEIKEKIKRTNIERYGVVCTLHSKEIQEKVKQTNIQRYGAENPLHSKEIQKKRKQTNLKKFGVENVFQLPETQEKIRQTNIEKYGSPYPFHKFGKTQEEIQNWINSYGFNFKSDCKILEGKELDLYDKSLSFAIEYCGLYWHHENSPQPRNKKYHFEKWKRCKEKNIQLLTIFEDEWLNNKEKIKSIILSKLGIYEKRIFARKCEVKQISKEYFIDFCEKYHIQGGNNLAKVCFGLFIENELIGVMDLGVHHRKKLNYEMVLTRLCFKQGCQITGGASKLFSACLTWGKENNIKKIISWSDNRYSNGSVYKNLKFKLIEELKPDYFYVKIANPKERISKQSQMKKKTNCPKNISEKDWALQNGLSRIWDCGKIRWEFDI